MPRKGGKMSDAQKAKISAAQKGRPHRPEHTAKLRGRPVSEETRKKISEAQKERWKHRSEEEKQHIYTKLHAVSGYWTGKKRPDIGASISAKNKGKAPPNKGIPMTPEQRATASAGHKRTWENATEERRERMIANWINASKHKRNTSIEQFMASKLDAQDIVYEREKRIGNYRVDFYIPATNTIIEVQGCYWHSCLQCGYEGEEHTARRNKDAKRFEQLRSKGYTVIDIWEHDLRKEMDT